MGGGVFGLKCRLDLALCLIHNHFHLFLVSSVRSSNSHPEQYFGASSGGGLLIFFQTILWNISAIASKDLFVRFKSIFPFVLPLLALYNTQLHNAQL